MKVSSAKKSAPSFANGCDRYSLRDGGSSAATAPTRSQRRRLPGHDHREVGGVPDICRASRDVCQAALWPDSFTGSSLPRVTCVGHIGRVVETLLPARVGRPRRRAQEPPTAPPENVRFLALDRPFPTLAWRPCRTPEDADPYYRQADDNAKRQTV